ncbi:hypothetical protein [Shouchella miscanthi]|uniref:hypothetical protein n=1 Tax=Shouchella miscanthi TaxID=2598861 RepID=UPI0011A06359|nr:hypothetical protein [Shouchella miscanthi]
MKKMVLSSAFVFSLSLFFGLANAEELGSKDPYGDINSPESIIDFLVNEAHVIPNPHHFESMATITATSRAGVSGAIGQVRGTATSSTTRVVDYVYARARIYQSGTVRADASDTSRKDNYAGAATSYVSKKSSGYTRGNHEYRHAGYKTINHVTRKNH